MTDAAWWDVIGDWCGWWRHVDEPELTEMLWGACAPPLRLALATRWVGTTTGEVDPTVTWPPSAADLHPLIADAFEQGPLDLVDFGLWLAGYLPAMTVTGYGSALSPHTPDCVPEPMGLVQLDHGRLDLGVVVRNGQMEITEITISGGLTAV